jgi:gamma-butyrobetaine dioxygenase
MSVRPRPSLIRRWHSFAATDRHLNIPGIGSFSYIWLRDTCRAPTSVHPSTQQKLFRSSDIALSIRPAENGIKFIDETLHIRWNDGLQSKYPVPFLQQHTTTTKRPLTNRLTKATTWDRQHIYQLPSLFMDYESIKSSSGISAAIIQLCQYGLLFIVGYPYC